MAPKKKQNSWEKSYPGEVSWNYDIPPSPVGNLLDQAASAYPERPCLDFYGQHYSYAQIHAMANRMAKGLQLQGVKKGDAVCLLLPNCPYYVVSYFALLKIGAVVVNLNPLYTAHELQHLIQDSGAKLAITMNLKVLHERTDNLLRTTPLERVIIGRLEDCLPYWKRKMLFWFKRDMLACVLYGRVNMDFATLLENDGKYLEPVIEPEKDVAVLQYTGGTTGVPKGAMLTHANIYANTMQAKAWCYGLEPGNEKFIAVLPFFHVFAMTAIMNLGISIGAELLLHLKFDLVELLKDITKKRPSVLMGVPTIFAAIGQHQLIDKYRLDSLKVCIAGGAPLPVPTKQAFETIAGCRLVEGYGLTEASPIVTVNPPFAEGKEGSIGLPLPGTIVEIRDVASPYKVKPVEEIGEICIKGPQVMLGYYNAPEHTQKELKNGRLHTGDMGYMDKDGYIFVVDRLKDVIIAGGFNIYPREVEDAIYQHTEVQEVAVIGVDDPYRGQTAKAIIKLRLGEEMTEERLLNSLKGRLAKYKVPTLVEFRTEPLPKTLIGKVDKKALVRQEKEKSEALNTTHNTTLQEGSGDI